MEWKIIEFLLTGITNFLLIHFMLGKPLTEKNQQLQEENQFLKGQIEILKNKSDTP